QQLDLEMSQLKNGTHPQYREFVDQVDARWTDRLEKIKQKMEFNRDLARLKLESSQRAATNTYIASRGELRRAMILRRKKQMWALADDLRNLERIREAIIGIACPLSNTAGPAEPVKGLMAPAHSSHLLSLPDTHLAEADEDADVSAICGIPALLNYDGDLVDTEDSSQTLIPTAADGMDIRVPVSRPGYAQKGIEESAVGNGDMAGMAKMAPAAAGYEGISASSQDYHQQAYAGHRITSDASHMAYNAPIMSHQDSAAALASAPAPAPVSISISASKTETSALTSAAAIGSANANINMADPAASSSIYHPS
ncbi:hypothetical protein LPJ56_007212, partial [Coemansia sp. RSA 2599]